VDRRELKVAYLPELGRTNRTALAGAGKGTPMLRIVEEDVDAKGEMRSALDELALEGARRMLAQALDVEVEAYLERHREERDGRGHALVVRNGHARERRVTVGSGTFSVCAPRVNDRRVVGGERQKFTSEILPPYLRRSKAVSEVLPVLYLRGLSTGDFREGLAALLGENAAGLSPSTITRLVSSWQDEYRTWRTRPLGDRDYVYVWADGVHFNVRLEDERLAALVVIGARPDGTKEVIALEDGYRESTESWLALLRDVKARGMRAPVVGVGDGALGFWAALREVFPETREERCWVHKIANVLDKLPKSLQPRAKAALHEMMNAPTKTECEKNVAAFVAEYEPKYPKATKALTTESDKLMTHFDLPAEHWKHLRTTNPIESTFATVKLRQRVTKGAGSRAAGLAMAYRLLLLAERSWRRLDGQELLPMVRAGVTFKDGVRVERDDGQATVLDTKRLAVKTERRRKCAA
jgi:putative transposase